MLLSNNVNRTVEQLPKDTYINLKKRSMVYVVTGSLFLIAGMQVANAEVCAPDVSYLHLNEYGQHSSYSYDYPIDMVIEDPSKYNEVVNLINDSIKITERDSAFMHQHNDENVALHWDNDAVVSKEMLKQVNCIHNGGKVAKSSADFDTNGNYKGSSQQASSKKYKSGKGNNQEQVATAETNPNGTDSNNTESSDAKSKGKEFLKNDNRLRADACVSVINKKNQLYGPAFKNICPYPIEVIWCANSKEDPSQCDRGWFNESAIGVGKSEPINAVYKTTHFVFSACHGVGSIFHTGEMDKRKEYRCVHWND